MEFTEDQKSIIKSWVEEGCGLAEIQRRLVDEMDVKMTYMDVRFLVLDLDVAIKEEEEKPAESEKAADDSVAESAADEQGLMPGQFSVEVDALQRPGALLSGTVTFSDGVSGNWMLDQMGRLGIEPSEPGYKPSEEDNAAFVQALQDAVAQKGLM